jgi:glycosyltransferase involved in cell wall biosynthesis
MPAQHKTRVLVIGHTYVTRIGREKWRELQKLYDVELRIIVPTLWKDYLFTIDSRDNKEEGLDVRSLPIMFSGKEAAHWYLSPDLSMSSFKPDILHVEEGTDALSYAQALTYKSLFASSARTLFFTWMNFEKKLKFPFTAIERFNLRRSDAAICGNSDAEHLLRGKGFTRPVTVMPLLGIDPDLFSRRDEAGLRASLDLKGLVIGFIGRFVAEKGVLDLIEAASRLRGDYTLLFVGGGALEGEMLASAGRLGISDRIRIVHSVPHAEIPRYINCMDMLVLPSYTVPHWKEQFGQVLVQAMSCQVPVLGSTHAEIPKVIGGAGMTFEERNMDDLSRKLELMFGNAELRGDLAQKGRERVLSLYTNTRIAQQTYDVYMNLPGGSIG